MEEGIIKSYKGMDKNMRCRRFQYEVGKTYETDSAKCCESGFHACEAPLDVFNYYPPNNSRYFEVEQSGEVDRDGENTKVSSTKMTVGAEIGILGLVKAHIEYVKARTNNEHTDPKAATAGKFGAATAGDSGAATAGDSGAATAGKFGAATSRGKSSVGENGIACARGNNVKVRGGIGAVLVLVEENSENYGIAEWKAFVIDGDQYKPDVWYMLRNGKIVEAKEGEA